MVAAALLEEVVYPSSDGEPMAETWTHVVAMIDALARLMGWYADRDDVLVVGNIFLYYEEGNVKACRSPDVMVVFGVPKLPPRESFFTWKEGAMPAVVIELTSAKTRHEDTGPKRLLYERLGVKEYFLFDPYGEWIPEQLIGYRLVAVAENGDHHEDARDIEVAHVYEPMMREGDALRSAQLGLFLSVEGDQLVFTSIRTGERLRTPEQMREHAQEQARAATLASRQAQASERAREEADRRTQAAQLALEEADRRARAAQLAQEEADRQAQAEKSQREEAERRAQAARLALEEADRRAQAAKLAQEEADRQAQAEKSQREEAERRAQVARLAQQEAERQQREAVAQADADRERLLAELARLRSLLPPDAPS